MITKQPPRGVLNKGRSENMQQTYRRTPMLKCDFNKVALQLYWNHTSAWVFSCKFAAYFQNTFSSEHRWVAASEWSRSIWFVTSTAHLWILQKSIAIDFLWDASQISGSPCTVDTSRTFLLGFRQYDTIITGLLIFHINSEDNTSRPLAVFSATGDLFYLALLFRHRLFLSGRVL